MKHLDLFSGIGGFALAIDKVFHEQKNEHIFCEIDPFCQAVLRKHWPESKIISDIKSIVADTAGVGHVHRELKVKPAESELKAQRELASIVESPFLLTGGFPCQPFSQAGRRKGTADDRHLWPEMLRVIRATQPQWVVAENVRGLLTIGGGVVFEQVCADLEGAGYEVQPLVIPAVAVNAPHRRDRVWFVAHRRPQHGSKGHEQGMEKDEAKRTARPTDTERCGKDATNAERTRHERQVNQAGQSARHHRGAQSPDWSANWLEVATKFCTLDDGLPDGLPRPKGWRNAALKACGNSIVPQVAEEIFQAIKMTPLSANE